MGYCRDTPPPFTDAVSIVVSFFMFLFFIVSLFRFADTKMYHGTGLAHGDLTEIGFKLTETS